MSRENPAAVLMRGLDAQVEAERNAGHPSLVQARQRVPVDAAGGWTPVVISTSNLNAAPNGAPFNVDLTGFAVVYCRDGSTPGVLLDFDFYGGGRIQTVAQGQQFGSYFRKLGVRLSADNLVTTGQVRLMVLRNPESSYKEGPVAPVAPATTTVQGNSTTADPIRPTQVTQGLPLAGVAGAKLIVHSSSVGVRTVNGGTVYWWVWDPVSLAWALGPVATELPTGVSIVATSDVGFGVGWGRVYPELRDYAEDSGSAGASICRVITWGAQ